MRVHIRTIDASTEELLPCRLSFSANPPVKRWSQDAQGRDLAYLGEPRVWSSGVWSGELPDRAITVIASRPYEYASSEAELGPDTTTAELTLVRRCDLPAAGWRCGDAHQHVVHGEALLHMDLPRAAAVARAEGVDWMVFDGHFTSVPGQDPPTPGTLTELCARSSSSRFTAFWADEYPKHDLGHLACLPLATDVAPVDIGGPGIYRLTPGERTPYTIFESLRALQEHGTTAIYVHPPRELGGTPGRPGNIARELPLDTLVAPWAVEAIDLISDQVDDPICRRLWYRLLNRGHRIGLCAFNDACYDRAGAQWHEAVAYRRTYVHTGQTLSRSRLVQAIRRGRTFGTTGPLVQLSLDGAQPGDSLPASSQPRLARIHAWGAPAYHTPRVCGAIQRVELVRDGECCVSWDFRDHPRERVELTHALDMEAGSWLIARIEGSLPQQLAITSPIYVDEGAWAGPQPLSLHVRGRVVDATTDQALDGRLQVAAYTHLGTQVYATGRFENGAFEVDLPGDLRLVAHAEGYLPQALSPILHCDPIYHGLLGRIRSEDLARESYYQQLEQALRHVELEFHLQRAAG